MSRRGRPALTVAIAGSPNVGKTTLFNALTGLCQHVGNWPGKTVEVAEGWHRCREAALRLVDLPGAYSLAGSSPEESLARDFILAGQADVTVVVLAPRGLQRHLYLALQIMEFTGPVVLALNLIGYRSDGVDPGRLQAAVGVPVVAISAARRQGLSGLVAAVIEAGRSPHVPRGRLGSALEEALRALAGDPPGLDGLPPRWEALCLLEGDPRLIDRLVRTGRRELVARAESLRLSLGGRVRERVTATLYAQAAAVEAACVTTPGGVRERPPALDRLLTHRALAYPLFGILLALVLWLTLAGAGPFTSLLRALFSHLAAAAAAFLSARGVSPWITGPLVDGLITGVGAVIAVMLPTMSLFFLLLALLEESGLVPRLALAADLPMRLVGSQGRHCLACLVALGCNIPGVYASRTMSGRPRLLAVLTASLVPCNGRLGVILPLSILFFDRWATVVVLGLMALSVAAVMLVSLLLSRTLRAGETAEAVMELPPYRLPHLWSAITRTFRHRVVHVLVRASLIAAPMTLLVWFLSNLPAGAGPEETFAALLAGWLHPAGAALGLDGRVLTAVLFSLPAKEVVLGALALTGGAARSLGEAATVPLGSLLAWSPFVALKFLIFFTLSAPCAYTILVIRRETRSAALTALGVALPLAAGCLTTWLTHLAGSLLGLG